MLRTNGQAERKELYAACIFDLAEVFVGISAGISDSQ
jgi:hypothetical protein